MKLGFGIGYSGASLNLPVAEIQLAEKLGFDSVWCAEAYGADAFTPLAYLAAHTSKIRLGTGIAQVAARPPANCAMVAQTVDALAGEGRVMVGLGLSGPQIVEGWYGQPWGRPAERLRDYVAIMRKVWRRDAPLSHDGSEIALPYTGPGSTGRGKALTSILHGNPDIPILLGTATPGNIRLTGEIADGWLGMHVTPTTAPHYRALIAEGMRKRGGDLPAKTFEMITHLSTHVTDDVKAAIDQLKPTIALYIGGMGSADKNYHKRLMVERGFADAAERIQALFMAGHKQQAAAAVPDEYIDDSSLIGPAARIRTRLREWHDTGFSQVVLRLREVDDAAIHTLARIARDHLG